MIHKIKMSENSIIFLIFFIPYTKTDKIPGISESVTHHTIVHRITYIFRILFMVHLCWYGCMKYRNSKSFSDCVKLHFLLHRQFFKMCNSWNSWYHFMRIKLGHFCFCACWDEESWFYHYSIVINFISHVIIQPKSICSFGGTSVTSTHTSVLL